MSDEATLNALVIDDERDVREMTRIALMHHGWMVRLASNGREALQLVRERVPDLIVLDLMMPEMSGIEFCRKLTGDLGHPDIPVILISGVNERAQLLADFWELPLRFRDFLHKPFGADQLLEIVARVTPRTRPAVQAPPTEPAPEPKSRPAPPPGTLSAQPAAAARPAAAASPALFQPKHKGYRVLVVDDDEDIRMIMQTGLGLYHKVETAENGMEGLHAFDRFKPDFIIMDYNMPVMNGLETAEAIRRHPRNARVPIFFLTGEGDKSLARKVYDVGGNLYLRKPLDPLQLLKYIDYFLGETGLKPGEAARTEPDEARPATDPRATPAIRLLTVDFNIEDQRLIMRLLGEEGQSRVRVPGGPFETIFTEEPHTALGNLVRWEPDIILYNPRNPHLDGVAFVQSLKLQKVQIPFQFAFIGARFFDADLKYSQSHFGRGVIDLSLEEAVVAQRLGETVAAARGTVRPKRFSITQVHREEVDRLKTLHASDVQLSRQRESFRKRYLDIQTFIDGQVRL